jgi:hypothetical protein
MMKKAIFLGASNTYGVGLHLFRDIYETEDNVRIEFPFHQTADDIDYIKTNRFSKHLSTYLNVEEINKSEAGGSPAESLYILSETNLDDVEYVFFEFSAIYNYFDRYFHTHFDFELNRSIPRTPTEIQSFLNKSNDVKLNNKIIDWIIDYNPKEFMNEIFIKIEKFINDNPHIKFIIMIWRENIDLESKELRFIKNNIVKFPLSNDIDNILVEKYLIENKNRVCDEFKWIHKIPFPPTAKELHPSLNGHNKIFEILKSYIDERNTLNNWR